MFLADAEVQRILDERVGNLAEHYGIVVGLVDSSGRRVVKSGHFDQGDVRSVDGDTLFELGSITKVFTALLLELAVERGEVALDDPLVKHLPAGTRAPVVDGREITLRDLATHTSGLPRTPKNLVIKDINDPYADYTVEMLYEYLGTAELASKPGTRYAYSNLGFALLARALMVQGKRSFAELVRERITEPLGMRNTWVDVPAERQASLALGHTQTLRPSPVRTRRAMIGNGGVISSANDMLTFLSASSGRVETPLSRAFSVIAEPQVPTGTQGGSIGLGWHMYEGGGFDVVWHNGATGGFATHVSYDRVTRQAVVVLSNVSTEAGVDDIGEHLLAARPLEPAGSAKVTPVRPRAVVPVEPRLLDGYVGLYEITPQLTLSVTREGGQLFAQFTGQPRLPVYAESERVFFLEVVNATLSFETDARGQAVAVVLRRNGNDSRFAKTVVSRGAPASPTEPSPSR
jgi:CubicO group peptidase (beta-lactamase class C family)